MNFTAQSVKFCKNFRLNINTCLFRVYGQGMHVVMRNSLMDLIQENSGKSNNKSSTINQTSANHHENNKKFKKVR